MANLAPRRYADQMFSDAAEAARRQADSAAQLYLRHAHHARGHFWSICQARQERAGLELLRDRRQPFAECAGAGSADGVAAEDRGGAWLNNSTSFGGVRRTSPESITTIGSMDSGPVASGRRLPTRSEEHTSE